MQISLGLSAYDGKPVLLRCVVLAGIKCPAHVEAFLQGSRPCADHIQ